MPRRSKVEAPKQVVALSVDQWRSSPELQAQLQGVLNESVFQQACATLLSTAMPATPSAINPAPNVSAEAMDKTLAYAFIDRAGFNRFYKRLHNLAKAKAEKKEIKHFGTLYDESE